MAHSHVPKFGNWDADNIPYSAYFENARREKAGFMMNPNDPMENPEAFNNMYARAGENVGADEVKASHTYSHNVSSMEKGSHEVLRNHTRRHLHHRSRGSQGSFTAEFASEKSHFDNPVFHRASQSDHKRSMSREASTIGSFSSSSHNRHRSANTSFNDRANHKATAVPQFGTWDVTDPKSGEGYTAIFGKIKEERQIMPSRISSISTPPLNNRSNIKDQYAGPSFSLSKAKANEHRIAVSFDPQET